MTKALAVIDFTIDGVPMLWNGEEVGNDRGGVDTHKPIAWNGPDAREFSAFYKSLIALRNANTALQQGTLTWVHSDDDADIVVYDRSDPSGEFLVEINLTNRKLSGSLKSLPNDALPYPWTEITTVGAPGSAHVAPPNYHLDEYDFAIFRRST